MALAEEVLLVRFTVMEVMGGMMEPPLAYMGVEVVLVGEMAALQLRLAAVGVELVTRVL
jgi:hypothetical protein